MNKQLVFDAVYASSGHIIKILSGFLLLKLMAFYLGAEGLGRLAHFMNFMTVIVLLSGGGVATALIKYVAEYKDNNNLLGEFLNTAMLYSFFVCIFTCIILIVFAKKLSFFIFGDVEYFYIIVLLSFAQFGVAFSNFVIGVNAGLSRVSTFVKIQMVSLLISSPISWFLVSIYGFPGAIFSIIFLYFSTFIPSIYLFRNFQLIKTIRKMNIDFLKKLLFFSLGALVSACVFPVVEILVRDKIIGSSGYESAGLWSSSMRLASAYLGVISAFLVYSFMPKISGVKSKRRVGGMVLNYAYLVSILFLIGASILYVCRDFFIVLFLSDSFLGLSELIIYQLVGDFFKVLSYVIGFVCVAKAAIKLYVFAEIFQGFLLLSMTYIVSNGFYNVENVMIAYALSSFTYFILCVVVFFVYLQRVE